MNIAENQTEQPRLSDLHVHKRNVSINHGYTRFVKYMRYILPLVAIILMVIIVTWPEMEDKVVVINKDEIIPQSENEIGENELLNPKFETTDAQNQPVSVTADRALQNQNNPNLVKLDKPNADLKMKNGSAVQIEALSGTYEQDTEKLFLQNDVKIRHETGYELTAEELRVDMKTREAFSDKNVAVTGPDAHIEATGLEGNVENGILIFKGPAKLTITNIENINDNKINEESANE
ncbi:MAG: LPS export ABC transporter periplasmic protein LptC [Alphaproteobacteria bacterium]|nr:LPS export ABC transporter periplasmic protein LptC [Alphaproteobacteria bacterium]